MTAKEKAKELVDKHLLHTRYSKYGAKQCALICVDEIIKSLQNVFPLGKFEYWQEVKKEIENL